MKNDHLTLRLPEALARSLARRARARGGPKSQLVREAVGRYLSGADVSTGPAEPAVTALELAERWAGLPRLTPKEAGDLAADLKAASRSLPRVRPAWE